MSNNKIRAITFDLWDTVIVDDSDEPKRKAQGLPPKPVARRNLVEEFLSRQAPISRDLVDVAYDTADAAFRQVWYEQNVTWTVRDRLAVVLKGLRRTLPERDFLELVRLHEEMELDVRPDFATGVHRTLRILSGKYKLAVVSDAIFSPGRALRELLKAEGVLDCFEVFVFSDEVGCSKPEPKVFKKAAGELGVSCSQMVHIGDREEKDVVGPHLVGAKAVLFTGVLDRGCETTQAEAVCANFEDLETILEEMNQRSVTCRRPYDS